MYMCPLTCLYMFIDKRVYVHIDTSYMDIDSAYDIDVYEIIYIQGRWQLTSKHESGPQGHGPEDTRKRPQTQSARVNLALWTIPRADRTSGDNELPRMKTVLYCRVSTFDQTLDHQRTQAQAAGFQIDEVVADHGVSGVRTALRERARGAAFV